MKKRYRVYAKYKGFDGTGEASRVIFADGPEHARELAMTPGAWAGVDFVHVVLTANEYFI